MPNRKCQFIGTKDKPQPLIITSYYYISYPPRLTIIFDKKFDTNQISDLFYYLMVRLRNDFVNFKYNFEAKTNILHIDLDFNIPTVYNASITMNFVNLIIQDSLNNQYLLEDKQLIFKSVGFLENKSQQSAYEFLGMTLYILVWVTIVASFLTLNKEVFFIINRACQIVQLVLFLNISKPNNLLALTKNFARTPFMKIYNPFWLIEVNDCGLKGSLSEKGLTCLLVDNVGSGLIAACVFIFMILILKVVLKFLTNQNNRIESKGNLNFEKSSKSQKEPKNEENQTFKQKSAKIIRENFSFPSLLNLFSCFSIDMTFYSFLQVIHVRTSPNYTATNSIMGIIIFFLSSFFIASVYVLLNTFERDRHLYEENYSYFLENLSTDKKTTTQKYYHPNLLLKNYSLCILIVSLNDYEFVHCLLFIIIQFLFISRGMLPFPYINKSVSVRELIHESYILAAGVTIFLGTERLKVFTNQSTRYHLLGNITSMLTAGYIIWVIVVCKVLIYKKSIKPIVDRIKAEKLAKKKIDLKIKESDGKKLIDDSVDISMLRDMNDNIQRKTPRGLALQTPKGKKLKLDHAKGLRIRPQSPSKKSSLEAQPKTLTIRRPKAKAYQTGVGHEQESQSKQQSKLN